MKTVDAFSRMSAAVPHINALLECEEMKAFSEMKQKGEMVGRDMLTQMMPILFQKHPQETMALIGAMNGKTAEEVAECDFEEVAQMMRDNSIENLYSFFIFSLRMGHLA